MPGNQGDEFDRRAKASSAEGRPPGSSTETRPASDQPVVMPERIGQFHIKHVLASGGMGTVYEAVQEHPRRTVAVKLLKHGVASRSAMRRFEYESQILARLRHPGIAQVYEAGTHRDESGTVPFFAMEYIPNAKSITKYAKEKKLSARERLELFAHVCDAVHHGHQKGIIHRDLKPGNILVDSHGEVKIIDFGVARGTDSDMAVTTLQTDVGQLIGTLQYMSPEQCVADPHDLDTRSDVYSLGVVLYQLLSGKLPYEVSRTRIFDGTRVIREEQPTHLSTLDPTLKGDVDTIASKALEKDRDHRYQSAFGLAQDIRRYLRGEPIVARPPSVAYQLMIFARKNRVLVGGVVAVFVALTLGVIGTSIGLIQANRQRVAAAREAAKARTTLGFLEERLRAVDPNKTRGREVTVRSMLDEAARQIEAGELADQPEAEASLRATLGQTYTSLGLYAAAEPHLRAALSIRKRVLGDEHPDVARSLHDLGKLFDKKFDFEAAEPLYHQALAMRRKLLGEEHRDTLVSMYSCAAALLWEEEKLQEAESLVRKTLEGQKRVLGREDPDTLYSMNLLAGVLQIQRRTGPAMALYRKTFEISRRVLGEDHVNTWMLASNLGQLLTETGNYAEAEPLLRQSLAMHRNLLGNEHPRLYLPLINLALLLFAKGEHAEAETLTREFLELDRSELGEQDPFSPDMLLMLAQMLAAQGKPEEARPYTSEGLAGYRRLAQRPQAIALDLNNYAWALLTMEPPELRDPDAALPLAKKAVEMSGGTNEIYLDTLALAYRMTGDIDKAVETQKQAVIRLAPGESRYRNPLELALVSFLREKGDHDAANAMLHEVIARVRRAHGEKQAELVRRMTDLALLLFVKGKHALHQVLCDGELTALRRGIVPQAKAGIAHSVVVYATALVKQRKYTEAEPYLRGCLEVRKAAYPEGDWRRQTGGWRIAHVMSLLGASLVGQDKFTEAEPLLLDAYNQMKDKAKTIPDQYRDERIREALERVINLYEAWDKTDQAAKWRAKRENGD